MTASSKTTPKILFLTLFLDLVGFSIIFPLFPALLDYYLPREGADSLLGSLVEALRELVGDGEGADWKVVVFFGGALGSLFGGLQFLTSPLWGRLSDRVGRRPVLLLTISGLAASYVLWFFSGSFACFVVSRILGGAMSGNISAVSASMADITSRADRAKGMGIIGAAFGLGFILGPAIGGFLAGVDLSPEGGSTGTFALNPFSAAAAGALVLSLLNLIWVWRRFDETLPPERRGTGDDRPGLNPIAYFVPRFGRSIHTVNLANFVFLLSFSGMEFTLTFLVRERLGWTPVQIGLMFVYVGFIIAFVQGGIVRRLAPRLGEKRVAAMGLAITAVGLLALGYAGSGALVYLSLAPMAVGSALTIPTLTSLASLLAPEEKQGAVLGTYRALGALARAVGPFLACAIYWQWDNRMPYLVGAAILVVPIVLVGTVPRPHKGD